MTGKRYDAVCIGTCLMDISVSGLDFDTFLTNEPNLASGIGYTVGGDAINEATVLSKLGFSTCLLSRVGGDFVGRFLLESATQVGIDVSHVITDRNVPTAANNILIGENDKRIYIISRNPTTRTELCGEDIPFDVLRSASLVSVGSIFVHPKLDNALAEILRAARNAGAVTCTDVCPSGEECSLEPLAEAMSYVDYFFANEGEARYLSKLTDPDDMADYFLGLGIGNVIIKFGIKGSLVKNTKERFFANAYPTKAVDTTGAGDCYAAGFMSGILRGLPLDQCARIASATGALAVRVVGATAGIVSVEQVDDFLRQQNVMM